MENLFKKYQEFREKNTDYFNYCQKAINEIADTLVSSNPEYQQLVNQFETEIKEKKQAINDFAHKLEGIRAQIIELDKQLKEESKKFEAQYREFEDTKQQLKQTERFAKLNKLDEEILNSFEKSLQDPQNKFNKAYLEEIEIIKGLKEAQK